MFGLSSIKKYLVNILLLICIYLVFNLRLNIYAQDSNPHGENFDIECESCHNMDTWVVDLKKMTFDHSETGFKLSGQHRSLICSDCHSSLEFNKVSNNCFSCHVDAHKNTLGLDCIKCHNTNSWQQVNFQQIHNQFRFPLTGVHKIENCELCHTNSENFIFSGASLNCFDCHRNDFNSAVNPQHTLTGFSRNCEECHTLQSFNWSAEKFKHVKLSFAGVHVNLDCNQCHNVSHPGFSQECYACHKSDYDKTTNPPHASVNYPHECASCHNTTTWAGAQFNHDQTAFPLTGSHRSIECISCHQSGYSGTPTQCFNCHNNSFNIAPEHTLLGYPHNCEMCHSTTTWNQVSFNHNTTAFQLTGSHINVECNSCHTSGFAGTPAECFECHQSAFSSAPNHLSQAYPHNCEMCHNTATWNQTSFNHSTTGFQLTGSHVNVTCGSCHENGFSGTPEDCFSCHQSNFNSADKHVSLNYPHACETCHNTTVWNQISFNHSTTGFQLTGSHVNTNCNSCHTTSLSGTPKDCFSCHQPDFNSAPEHVQKGYPHTCETCHNTSNWDQESFDHNTTGFVLTGSHTTTACSDCHSSGFSGTSKLCQNCHTDDYNSAANPSHKNLNLPLNCEQCHSTSPGWAPAQFPMHENYFAFAGTHVNIKNDCNSCHNGNFNNTPDDCFGCHQSAFNSAPDHLAKKYPHTCEMCHNNNVWTQTNFDHNSTGFSLAGEHQKVECSSCHENGFEGTPTTCISCHNQDFQAAPQHVAQGFPQNCVMCHNTIEWGQTNFNHNTTAFQLTGSHVNTSCNSCHSGGFTGTPKECFSCHEAKYNSASEHAQKGYPHTCATCHNTTSWEQTTFDHNSTGFPLTGDHRTINCNLCHSSGFSGTPKECFSCHQDNFNAANKHVSLNYPHECATCHNTTLWNQINFNHGTTSFQLTGSHINTNCNSCHTSSLAGTSKLCFNCHEPAFNSAPDHLAKGYPHACETCHNTTLWNQVTFNHNVTAFALTGAHNNVNCSDCHSSGFAGTPKLCQNCHTDDYNSAANPSHKNLNLPLNCEQCHSTSPGWAPAQFPMHDNYFTFAGAHIGIKNNCSTCHNGNFNNIPATCYGCHQTDYNNTTNPRHASIGFPQSCTDCHSQTGWTPATFNHDSRYFPIYSGKHRGKWDNCSDCHTNAANFNVFSCFNCHEHNRNEMDNKHKEVGGYSYNSLECYRCHPRGDSDEGLMNSIRRNRIDAK